MKKQLLALLVCLFCGFILGSFVGTKLIEPMRATFFDLSDIYVTTHQIVASLSTFFAGALRLSVKL